MFVALPETEAHMEERIRRGIWSPPRGTYVCVPPCWYFCTSNTIYRKNSVTHQSCRHSLVIRRTLANPFIPSPFRVFSTLLCFIRLCGPISTDFHQFSFVSRFCANFGSDLHIQPTDLIHFDVQSLCSPRCPDPVPPSTQCRDDYVVAKNAKRLAIFQ